MKIFIAGTFDHFHVGHQYLVWLAYNQSVNLIIIVARDLTVKKIKGSLPSNNEQSRLNRLKKEFEDFDGVHIQLGNRNGDFLKTLKEQTPSHLFLGYDQCADILKIKKEFPNLEIKKIESYFPKFFKSSKF